jgi:hypothetical protein
MTTSEQTNEIAGALVKAQASMKNAALNKVNPHFKSKYADLAGIRDTVIPALTANGIALVQTLDMGMGGTAAVMTRLLHVSGQWIESLCPIPPAPDMQKMGSAITYARRYSLSAICGIAADEDDDGNQAAEQGAVTPAPAKATAVPEGYGKWLADMRAYAVKHTEAELVSEIADSGSPEQKAHLRSDLATWNALRTQAAKNTKKAAA